MGWIDPHAPKARALRKTPPGQRTTISLDLANKAVNDLLMRVKDTVDQLEGDSNDFFGILVTLNDRLPRAILSQFLANPHLQHTPLQRQVREMILLSLRENLDQLENPECQSKP